jgi:hypothetical protein
MNLKKLLPIIGIFILIFILFTLDIRKIIDIFLNINPIYTILSFFILVPLLVLVNIEWQMLLRKQKIRVSFWYSIKNFFIGYFYGFVTPGGFGAYTRAIYLSDESNAPLPKCLSNIIIFNIVEFFSMMTVGAVGAIFLSSIYPYLFYTIIVILVIVLLLYSFFFKKERSKLIFTRIVKMRIFENVKDKVENSIDSFYEDLPKFKDVLIPYGLSITGWFLKYILYFFIAKLFLIEISIFYFIMIMAVADVIASIPISIYGIGTRELALITMFGVFVPGVTEEQIVSLSLFWFVISWLTPSIIGAFVTVSETRKVEFKLNNKTASEFEKYMQKYPKLYQHLAEIVKKNLPKKKKNPKILDLGIGPGLLSKEIINKIPNANIIGVDPSEEMLKLANMNIKNKKFETRLGSSEKIPVTNAKIDLVVSRFSLTYWNNPITSFSEINRVLNPKGKIVIEFLNKDFSKLKLFLIKMNMYFKSASSNVINYHISAYDTAYSIDTVKELLRKSGFKLVYEEGSKKDWKYIIVGQRQ